MSFLIKRINRFLIKHFSYALIEHRYITYDTCNHCHKKVEEHSPWVFSGINYKLCDRCTNILETQLYNFLNPHDVGKGDILYLKGKN